MTPFGPTQIASADDVSFIKELSIRRLPSALVTLSETAIRKFHDLDFSNDNIVRRVGDFSVRDDDLIVTRIVPGLDITIRKGEPL